MGGRTLQSLIADFTFLRLNFHTKFKVCLIKHSSCNKDLELHQRIGNLHSPNTQVCMTQVPRIRLRLERYDFFDGLKYSLVVSAVSVYSFAYVLHRVTLSGKCIHASSTQLLEITAFHPEVFG